MFQYTLDFKYQAILHDHRMHSPQHTADHFTTEKSEDKWLLTDVTKFKCTNGKLYLSPILDMFNREIIAYSLERRANSKMVAQMLDKASGRLKGQTPLLHTDQGVLYS